MVHDVYYNDEYYNGELYITHGSFSFETIINGQRLF